MRGRRFKNGLAGAVVANKGIRDIHSQLRVRVCALACSSGQWKGKEGKMGASCGVDVLNIYIRRWSMKDTLS